MQIQHVLTNHPEFRVWYGVKWALIISLRCVLFFALCLTGLGQYTWAEKVDRTPCDDILSTLHAKPDHLEFLSCKQRSDLQGQPWEATYRAAGRYAAHVENALLKEFNIKKLTHTCCQWDSTANSFRDLNHHLHSLSISTEETTISRRSEWKKIPYFYVTVDSYAEDP